MSNKVWNCFKYQIACQPLVCPHGDHLHAAEAEGVTTEHEQQIRTQQIMIQQIQILQIRISRLRWFECTSHTYVSKCFSWVLFLTLTLTRFLISIPPGIIKRRPTDLCSTWGRCWTRRARKERQHSHRGQVWDHLNALLPLSQSNLSVQNVWRCWEGKVEMKWHIDGDRFRTLQAD